LAKVGGTAAAEVWVCGCFIQNRGALRARETRILPCDAPNAGKARESSVQCAGIGGSKGPVFRPRRLGVFTLFTGFASFLPASTFSPLTVSTHT